MNRTTLVCLSFLWLVFAPNEALSKQLSFQKKQTEEATIFKYRWFDGERHFAINFALNNFSLQQLPDSPIRYNNQLLQQEIVAAIRRYAVEVSADGVQVVISRLGLTTEYQVRAPNDKVAKATLAHIENLQEKVKREYYKENYFLNYTSPQGETGIQHDFERYVEDSKNALMPIVDAIKAIQQNTKDYREFISIALSWVQSIPYNDLRSRISSNGSGFASPKDLILQNRGDCDSKSTLFAALLQAYNEQIKVSMVLLPNHALLAIGLRALPNEKTVKHEGVPYVLIEPTGPAYFKIGEADEDSLLAIRNRQYSLAPL
ncbi:hypothetical protein [Agaribacter flavus]|uniref:Transglutaminase domain-containing protein n=1 Tax=Agaribacter flavus TaxID=1902781 RepID=A0ABV7FLF3_9ALTE